VNLNPIVPLAGSLLESWMSTRVAMVMGGREFVRGNPQTGSGASLADVTECAHFSLSPTDPWALLRAFLNGVGPWSGGSTGICLNLGEPFF